MVSISSGTRVRRWPLVILGILSLLAVVFWWPRGDQSELAVYRLDAAAVRALPADASGNERLLKHLGSLLRDGNDTTPWLSLHGPQRAVLVVLTFEGMVSHVGLGGYVRFVQQGPPVPALSDVAEAYQDMECEAAAMAIDEVRILIDSNHWPAAGTPQANACTARVDVAMRQDAPSQRKFITAHAEDIATVR